MAIKISRASARASLVPSYNRQQLTYSRSFDEPLHQQSQHMPRLMPQQFLPIEHHNQRQTEW